MSSIMIGCELASVARTWRFIWTHPVSSRHRRAAFLRWIRWQLGIRLLPGDAIVPFIQDARLVVRRGMAGATGNIYSGLHEFEDMAFAFHLLRPGDLFVDVGANVGAYTVVSACAGARCISAEPVPATYSALVDNLRLNGLMERVNAVQTGVGGEVGKCDFTSDLDSMNHVVSSHAQDPATISVPMTTLDALVGDDAAALLKIDVEGFETEVINGGSKTLASPQLLAIIIELNDSGRRYGYCQEELIRRIRDAGFSSYEYEPFSRVLRSIESSTRTRSGNVIFVRSVKVVEERLRTAPPILVAGESV